MSSNTRQLIEICEQLPESDQAEVADFARFLLAKHQDDAWEQTIANPKARPKLDAFVKEALVEGSEVLDEAAFDRELNK